MKFRFSLDPFYETPGDGGSGGGGDAEHPDFPFPGDEGTPGGQPPAGTPPAPARQPAPATPGRASAAPLSGQPGAPADGGRPGGPPQTIDYARFQEVVNDRNGLREKASRVDYLERQLQSALGFKPAAGGPDAASEFRAHVAGLKPEDRGVIDYFDSIVPTLDGKPGGFTELMEMRQQLKDALEHVGGLRQSDEYRWQTHGRQTWSDFDKAVTDFYKGPLAPEAQSILDQTFAQWLQTDTTAQQRYLQGDRALVADFFTLIKTGLLEPAHRVMSAPVNPSLRPARPAVPRGGAGVHVGRRPEQPSTKDPDAVHQAAADAAFGQ
jgi:hypothetical protein